MTPATPGLAGASQNAFVHDNSPAEIGRYLKQLLEFARHFLKNLEGQPTPGQNHVVAENLKHAMGFAPEMLRALRSASRNLTRLGSRLKIFNEDDNYDLSRVFREDLPGSGRVIAWPQQRMLQKRISHAEWPRTQSWLTKSVSPAEATAPITHAMPPSARKAQTALNYTHPFAFSPEMTLAKRAMKDVESMSANVAMRNETPAPKPVESTFFKPQQPLIDIDRLTDQVYQEIERKIRIEQERRGL